MYHTQRSTKGNLLVHLEGWKSEVEVSAELVVPSAGLVPSAGSEKNLSLFQDLVVCWILRLFLALIPAFISHSEPSVCVSIARCSPCIRT